MSSYYRQLSRQNAFKHIESVLTPRNYAGPVHGIKQHAPVSGLDHATTLANKPNKIIDTIISIGGGSPIDAGKIISQMLQKTYFKIQKQFVFQLSAK